MSHATLPKQIFLSILIGIALGVFLGPICSIFDPIGTAYIMFIQMVIILYIPCSIIHGLGSRRPHVAYHVFRKGWFFILFVWALVYITMFAISFIFPRTAFVVKGTGVTSQFQENFLNYLVPQNPIYDLANNIVPAIAIFGIVSGLALMHLKHKEPIISMFEGVNSMLEKILKGLTIASPIGVLAIVANLSGNIYWVDIREFSLYIIPFIFIVIILTFWALPALITSFSPLSYKEIITEFRTTCLLAFLIGSPSIAIPFLNQCVRRYSDHFAIKDKELHTVSQMIVPVTYTFTQIGNLLILFFMMYITYYFDTNIKIFDKILTSILALPMSFGGPEMMLDSIVFLSKRLGLPDSTRILYDRASVITQSFQVLLSTGSMVTFVILLLLAYYNRLKFQFSKFFSCFFIFFFVLFFGVFGSKLFVEKHFKKEDPYETMSVYSSLKETREYTPVKVYKIGEKLPDMSQRASISKTDERIIQTKTFYVGYQPNIPPFCYFNKQGELAGYSTALAYALANDLKAKLVFIPCFFEDMGSYLYKNMIDTTTMPVLLPETLSSNMGFSNQYMQAPFALIAIREREKEFANFFSVRKEKDLKIGTIGFFTQPINDIFPRAKVVSINNMDQVEPLMSTGDFDAFFCEKECAIGYCRKHPAYVTIDYPEIPHTAFLGFPTKTRSQSFLNFLNRWLMIQEKTGFIASQYDYWILRKPKTNRAPRWNVLYNVFGFGFKNFKYKEGTNENIDYRAN